MSACAVLAFGEMRSFESTSALRVVRPRRVSHALIAILALSLGFGCPQGSGERDPDTLPLVTTDNPDAERDFRAAERAAAEGDAAGATSRYEAFLREHPSDPLAPLAKLGLGELRLASGDVEAARALFAEVREHTDTAVRERAQLLDGVALQMGGHAAEALALLRPLEGRTVAPRDTALLLTTVAAAAERSGDRVAALEALDRLLRDEGIDEEEKTAARARVDVLLGAATPEELTRAADTLDREGVVWPLLAQRAMREAYSRGDMASVRTILDGLRSRGVELDDELSAIALRAEREGQPDTHAIGAILPMSGRGRAVGQSTLEGLLLAAGTPPQSAMSPDAPQIVFRDDGGDPERAARAVEDLVSLHRVIAIVGPLTGATATRAAARAQELGVPLLTLSPASGLAQRGPMIFQLFPTPRNETDELVAAAYARGARRFAVLYPTSPYGEAMRQAFAASVEARHATLDGAQSYDAAATSFGPQVAAIAAARPDAIFVADAHPKLALIAPALAAAGLWSAGPETAAPRTGRTIIVLAPSVGFDPQVARASGRYLQGAIFSVPFHAPTAVGEGRSFVDAYQQRFGAAPDVFAAYGYDAARLVRDAVREGATSREEVAERLAATRRFATAGAAEGFAESRESSGGTRLLTLRESVFEPLDAVRPSARRVSARNAR